MNRTFSMYPLGSAGSDCTAPYRLHINGTPSVGEVVTDILSGKEWGTIKVFSKGRNAVVCSMSYDQNTTINKMNPGYNNHIVIDGHSAGGWSNMDYTLIID